MADLLHQQLATSPVTLRGRPVVGFGQGEELIIPAAAASPWAMAFATSVVGAAAGWVIEEIATHVRGPRRAR